MGGKVTESDKEVFVRLRDTYTREKEAFTRNKTRLESAHREEVVAAEELNAAINKARLLEQEAMEQLRKAELEMFVAESEAAERELNSTCDDEFILNEIDRIQLEIHSLTQEEDIIRAQNVSESEATFLDFFGKIESAEKELSDIIYSLTKKKATLTEELRSWKEAQSDEYVKRLQEEARDCEVALECAKSEQTAYRTVHNAEKELLLTKIIHEKAVKQLLEEKLAQELLLFTTNSETEISSLTDLEKKLSEVRSQIFTTEAAVHQLSLSTKVAEERNARLRRDICHANNTLFDMDDYLSKMIQKVRKDGTLKLSELSGLVNTREIEYSELQRTLERIRKCAEERRIEDEESTKALVEHCKDIVKGKVAAFALTDECVDLSNNDK